MTWFCPKQDSKRMLEDFYKWRNVNKLNRLLLKNDSEMKYILIIPKTINFELLNDLNRTFKRKWEIEDYMNLFQESKCYLLYFTLFTLKEKNEIGPIADNVCFQIISRHLHKILKKTQSNVQIVGPNYLKHTFEILSYDTFIERFQ